LDLFTEAIEWIENWAKSRNILTEHIDTGFLTLDILELMLLYVIKLSRPPFTASEIVRKFFTFFSSEFQYNESSVAGQVSRSQIGDDGTIFGSVINDQEGIDSDVDDVLRSKRISNITADEESPRTLSAHANDNDEVHSHKRQRFELGLIRDVRRFYEVENTRIDKVCASDNEEKIFKDHLDYIDVFTVCHPFVGFVQAPGEHVNMAVRVLESHRKVITQELSRAAWILSDSCGDDFPLLMDQVCAKQNLQSVIGACTIKLVFQVESSSQYAQTSVLDVIQSQTWYLIQELQAFEGVMVVPFACPIDVGLLQENSADNESPSAVIVGILFPQDQPYCARPGIRLDFGGLVCRNIGRVRRAIRERPDFNNYIDGKFKVSCYVRS
jgi:hypothetical protein